jgi:predicted permease
VIAGRLILDVLAPVFALIGAGVAFDRAFRPDLPTLSKLNFYVFTPALVFVKLLESRLDGGLVAAVAGFNALHFALLWALAAAIFRRPAFRPRRGLMTMGAVFNNSGNYGLPFAQLAFGDRGVEIMALIMVFQNVATFTVGLGLVGGHADARAGLREIARAPVIYAVAAALALNALRVTLPRAVAFPLEQLGNGLIPIALLTLGVQLSRTRPDGRAAPLAAVVAMRLLVAPALAAGLAVLWSLIAPLPAGVVPVLVCAAGLPVAVNVHILALEYRREPEFAARMVLWSTVASVATLAAWLAGYAA